MNKEVLLSNIKKLTISKALEIKVLCYVLHINDVVFDDELLACVKSAMSEECYDFFCKTKDGATWDFLQGVGVMSYMFTIAFRLGLYLPKDNDIYRDSEMAKYYKRGVCALCKLRNNKSESNIFRQKDILTQTAWFRKKVCFSGRKKKSKAKKENLKRTWYREGSGELYEAKKSMCDGYHSPFVKIIYTPMKS